jgi:ATP-dependent DNA ligase
VAFDLLIDGKHNTRQLPLAKRRVRLWRLVERTANPLLQLISQTPDIDAANAWLGDKVTMSGIEGVVAKRDEPYPRPNEFCRRTRADRP